MQVILVLILEDGRIVGLEPNRKEPDDLNRSRFVFGTPLNGTKHMKDYFMYGVHMFLPFPLFIPDLLLAHTYLLPVFKFPKGKFRPTTISFP